MGIEYDVQTLEREIDNMQVGLANLAEQVNEIGREELRVEDVYPRSNLNPGTKETKEQKEAREKYEKEAAEYNEKAKQAEVTREAPPPSPPLTGGPVYPQAPDASEAAKEAAWKKEHRPDVVAAEENRARRAAKVASEPTAPKTPTEEATASQGAVTSKTVRT